MVVFLLKFLNINVAFCDIACSWQVGPQDPATPVMEGMIGFHNYLMFFMILIGILVFYMLFAILVLFNEKRMPSPNRFVHSSLLEIIWTILPAVVLLLIAIPSFSLLYSLDEVVDPTFTLRVVGHQWYWTYDHNLKDLGSFNYAENNPMVKFESYMLPDSRLDKKLAPARLLQSEVVLLPTDTHIRVLVTSSDVIHSWAVPSFGIKIDATPGRLTQGSLFIKRSAFFYGQCSEICGVNHAFMPIVIGGVEPEVLIPFYTRLVMEANIEGYIHPY